MRRLVEKGAGGVSGTPRAYRYAALVTREACVRAENCSFLNRLDGGSITPMPTAFLRNEQLTRETRRKPPASAVGTSRPVASLRCS